MSWPNSCPNADLCVVLAGNLVGLFLSPLLLQKLGWRGLFYTFGVLGLPLLAIWLAVVPKPKPKPEAAPPPEQGFIRATTPHPNPIIRYVLTGLVCCQWR